MRAPVDDDGVVVEETLAVENPRADQRRHQIVSVTLCRLRGWSGLRPRRRDTASARPIEAVDHRDRRQQRRRRRRAGEPVAGVDAACVDPHDVGAGGGEQAQRHFHAVAPGVGRHEGDDEEAGPRQFGGPVQHFRRRIGLGVNGAGLLELQRRLGGDREGRAASEHEGDVRRARAVRSWRRAAARSQPAGAPAGRRWRAVRSASPRHAATSAAPATRPAIMDFVAATDCSRPGHQRQQFFGLGRQRRVDFVDHGDASSRPPCAPTAAFRRCRGCGPIARSRRRRRARDAAGAVERGDRRADRGAGDADDDLRQIFQIERAMVRAAARDRRQHRRIERAELASQSRRCARRRPRAGARSPSPASSISARMWVRAAVIRGSFVAAAKA